MERMSAEKASRKHYEMGAASRNFSNEELLEENARLRAQVSDLQERLTQAESKTEQESSSESEFGRKRRWNTLDGADQQRIAREGNAMTHTKHGHDRAPKQVEQEKRETGIENITELPSAVLGHALQYLTFLETRLFFGCGNRVLWEERRVDYDSEMTHKLVLPARPPYAFLRSNLMNVCSLDLGPWCSNVVLALMCDEQVLPNLKHLGMARSVDVTDEGLALLSQNPVRRRKLKSLDIQFCRRLSFGRTLDVTESLDALDRVRRQPPWLDGLEIENNGAIYTSWANGIYACWDKDGRMEQCGYLCDLYENGSEDCVVVKAQKAFVNHEFWQSHPEWEFYANRLGYRYLRVPDGHVLEAHLKKGLYPPNNFPRAEHANSVALGEVKHFDEHGDECNEDDPDAYACVENCHLKPLDVIMPPSEVVELCRTHLNNMYRVMAERDEEQDERQAHVYENGDENDEPPPEWFQYYP